MTIEEKFAKLGVDNAPGQEVRRKDSSAKLTGEELPGTPRGLLPRGCERASAHSRLH